MTDSYDEAINWITDALAMGQVISVGLVMDAGDMLGKTNKR